MVGHAYQRWRLKPRRRHRVALDGQLRRRSWIRRLCGGGLRNAERLPKRRRPLGHHRLAFLARLRRHPGVHRVPGGRLRKPARHLGRPAACKRRAHRLGGRGRRHGLFRCRHVPRGWRVWRRIRCVAARCRRGGRGMLVPRRWLARRPPLAKAVARVTFSAANWAVPLPLRSTDASTLGPRLRTFLRRCVLLLGRKILEQRKIIGARAARPRGPWPRLVGTLARDGARGARGASLGEFEGHARTLASWATGPRGP
mmetsp:Transcript_54891/g.166805  ORF Transcript_54891/g.166805 Transcript_54891/m.166805 type:complete len:255 (-) Transcript_54891:870-1634(-)